MIEYLQQLLADLLRRQQVAMEHLMESTNRHWLSVVEHLEQQILEVESDLEWHQEFREVGWDGLYPVPYSSNHEAADWFEYQSTLCA